jgi:hypothetical protein
VRLRNSQGANLQTIRNAFFAVASSLLMYACASVTLAPGAEKVRLTEAAADVANCKAVGNVQVRKRPGDVGDLFSAPTQFRNQTLGFGGNIGFVTEGGLQAPAAGVAYQCP